VRLRALFALACAAFACDAEPLVLGEDYGPAEGSSAIAFVQGAGFQDQTFARTVSLAFAAPATPGDLIVVAASWGDDSVLAYEPVVTDSAGNAYAAGTIDFEPANSQSLMFYYAPNVAGGATTVTVRFNGPGYSECGSPSATCNPDGVEGFRSIVLAEYRGVAKVSPLVASAKNIFSGGCAPNRGIFDCPAQLVATSGSAHVPVARALAVGVTMNAAIPTTRTTGPGWARRAVDVPDDATPYAQQLDLQDRIVASPGDVASTETLATSVDYLAQLLVFKPEI